MKWMPMREFLRGGYKNLDDTTVVSVHGRPVFTVIPYKSNGFSGNHAVFVDPSTGMVHDPLDDLAKIKSQR